MPFSPRPFHLAAFGVALSATLAGCSPTYNWREVRFEDASLLALLPCKPDRAQKPVSLGGAGEQVPLSMMGCEAGGATFTLSHLHLDAGSQAGAAISPLAQWQSATEARLGAKAHGAVPFAPHGAAVMPGSVKLEFAARGPGDKPLRVQLATFMRHAATPPGSIDLFQAAIYSGSDDGRIDQAASENFFSGLRLN